ncbi:MAG: hypothetical protein Sylvanvirus10_15 [Sylvanvirus sp.]|uniref:Uncharacterized protein n=1 Tax=Sylvanvirus sp. TaxID=2487774 RepID=A0A3G5AI32_9VIRU|nr:MAG: hypothetical protein Sylvanvirus10_15 [Sylvanvirus sp.]
MLSTATSIKTPAEISAEISTETSTATPPPSFLKPSCIPNPFFLAPSPTLRASPVSFALLFYEDHNAQYFLDFQETVLQGRFVKWLWKHKVIQSEMNIENDENDQEEEQENEIKYRHMFNESPSIPPPKRMKTSNLTWNEVHKHSIWRALHVPRPINGVVDEPTYTKKFLRLICDTILSQCNNLLHIFKSFKHHSTDVFDHMIDEELGVYINFRCSGSIVMRGHVWNQDIYVCYCPSKRGDVPTTVHLLLHGQTWRSMNLDITYLKEDHKKLIETHIRCTKVFQLTPSYHFESTFATLIQDEEEDFWSHKYIPVPSCQHLEKLLGISKSTWDPILIQAFENYKMKRGVFASHVF